MNAETPQILTILQKGEMTLRGQFVHGSNYTFLASIVHQNQEYPAVYKPVRGEQPLWDFPAGSLSGREVAAYLVSEFLGWRLVPPTVYRRKAPLGPGSVQLYIEHDPQYHYFSFTPEDRQLLRPVVLFDLVINNADRKGGHVLMDENHHIWLIDHGICFHEEDKLRTVIWDFAGEPIPTDLLKDITRLLEELTQTGRLVESLTAYLSPAEIRALERRTRRLIENGCFPHPAPSRRPYPWPPV
ncbi:conserved hypothetical protein [Bellilinea caldifistulae]|uniref:PI3K/PI4K catalytic domain-containing protein n=1 Tax=Bellilinea caldifistulae TaxID=360411 RepID=A0A0N8GMI3_9CHLR|nr:SCO1664 family protein [Bellilinea caldifistulae]KPL75378.1 hypothetical protein AC812_08835 [Bellilinea caldifistulae]GAP09811.1 conserved hypothetical protein [Bellilinea caldifistulae]